MFMIFNIILFKSTGFNNIDIPFNADIVTQNYTPHGFNAVWLLQNKGLDKVRIQASYDEVDGADYCVVQKPGVDVWYFITSIKMLNENTCELTLQIDALTTIGLENVESISGWCIRRHVRDDSLFSNVKNEPWTPTQELVLDQGKEIKLQKKVLAGSMLVGATFNLSGDYTKAQKFVAPAIETVLNEVCVPLCPMYEDVDFIKSSSVSMRYSDSLSKESMLPLLRLFNGFSNGENINIARSLSLDTGITCSYYIPPEYVGKVVEETDGYNQIENNYGLVNSDLNYEYATGVLNKKVFALFNTYTLSSICSGESNQFSADEIYHAGDVAPSIAVWADLSPEGNPYFRPEYYKGNNVDFMMECIKGSSWQNTPIGFSTKSGSDFTLANWEDYINIRGSKQQLEWGNEALSIPGDIARLNLSSIQNIGVLPFINLFNNRQENRQFRQDNFYITPEIKFPRSTSIQNFVGNTAWIYRTRLSENDVKRFDKFLSMYGYSADEELTADAFTCRKNFNYVQCEDVHIICNQSLWLRSLAEAQLSQGVRLWHVKPNPALYNQQNPVVPQT